MKTHYLLPVLALIIGLSSFAQRSPEAINSVESITNELRQWDAIRGPWLAQSVAALSKNEAIPGRTFPENFTPHQMMRKVPIDSRNRLLAMSHQNPMNDRVLNQLANMVRSVECQPVRGRSYGDPHLVSYDGARYSFQTVGEFVMTKSMDGQIEVQTRQKPQKQDFSLNTAIAMNVSGDRVCIYASDYPDSDYSTPVRVNGQSLRMTGKTYFLNNGGTIRKISNNYTVHWPTGESVNTEIKRSGNMDFLNIGVSIIPCSRIGYDGLMGNANGSEFDDYRGSRVARRIPNDPFGDQGYGSKERQAYLARQFADQYRIIQLNSLFDYRPGTSTETYTDRSFPRVFHDMNDLNQRTLNRARRNCEEQGISARDIQGCIYDNAYLNIAPTNEPLFTEPTDGVELRPVVKPMVNDNQGTRPFTSKPAHERTEAEQKKELPNKPKPATIKPVDEGVVDPINQREEVKEVPVVKPTPRPPSPKPKPTPRPRPVRLKPTPVPKPRPVVTPPPSRPSAPRQNQSPKPVSKPPTSKRGRG
ncbi:MAG: VWD domain-containing protein [Crocinitomicaceae bacterium]|nr:VWD domain-containing protein [Crocinitomicaceae bacterium]MDG1777644.1 VWD domain-containing protein [Crocinitomicaceae bacterium]